MAFDISGFWTRRFGPRKSSINGGFSVTNIGTKISYGGDDNAEFLPTNLGIGIGANLDLHRQHQLRLYAQVDKYLVPTYPKQKNTEADNDYTDRVQRKYYDISPIQGIFKSFSDAPNGFREEMQEISPSLGLEYVLCRHVAFRQGFHYESRNKGGRTFGTIGIGVITKPVDVNIGYIYKIKTENALNKTFMFDIALKQPYFD